MKSLFFLAGEKSGDLLGASLLQQLQGKEISFFGVGGPLMRDAGLQVHYPMEKMQIMGLIALVKQLKELPKQFRLLTRLILEKNPDGCILIDYPGFNLRLARALRKKGYQGKIIQYVSPTVWAWKKGRVKTLARYYDLLLTIFPFEAKYYAHTSLPVHYVGHPLAQEIEACSAEKKNLLALFPGSRKNEIEKNLPLQLEIAKKIENAKIEISCADSAYTSLVQEIAGNVPISSDARSLMRRCHAAIAKSGTVTLELGLHGKPAIVTYKMDPLHTLLARTIGRARLHFACMVNILADKELFPEFVLKSFTIEEAAGALQKLLGGEGRATCLAELQSVQEELRKKNASRTAAEQILSLIYPSLTLVQTRA